MSYSQNHNNRDSRRHNPYPQNQRRDNGGRGSYSLHGGGGRGGAYHSNGGGYRQGVYDGGGRRNERDGRGYNENRQRGGRDSHHYNGPPPRHGNEGNEEQYGQHQNGYGRERSATNHYPRPDVQLSGNRSAPLPEARPGAVRQDGHVKHTEEQIDRPDLLRSSMNVNRNEDNQGAASQSLPTTSMQTDKDFLSMSYVEQLEAQIPSSETDKITFKRNLPPEAIEPYSTDGVKSHSEQWKADKEEVASKVVQDMKQALGQSMANNAYDMESDDSEASGCGIGGGGGGGCQLTNEMKLLENFILALPTCHLMTVGFDYSGSGAEEKCFCPCHRRYMSNWRTLVSVGIGEGECKANGRFEKPNHLIAHMKSMKNCRFHQYALQYLEELYSNWHHHMKHKGLYIENSPQYREAEAREKRRREVEFQRMRKQVAEMLKREEREKKIEVGIETLRNTNVDLAEKLEVRGEMLKLLGADPTELQSIPKEDMIPEYEMKYQDYWKRTRRRFGVDMDKSTSRTICVKDDFSLQEYFDMWCSPKAKNKFASILFKDLSDQYDISCLLSRWTIEFKVVEAVKSLSRPEMASVTAIDEGGPEAQFFSQVWRQLSGLEVSLGNGTKSIKLFQTDDISSGYLPTSDLQFQSRFKNEEYNEIKQKAELYYRAIGRLFAHCLSVGHKLPTEALPPLLRNAAIRGCMPTSRDYLDLDLADHLVLVGLSSESLKYYIQESESKDDVFRKNVYHLYIAERDIWMQSFREGLYVKNSETGEECILLSDLLRFVPLDVVDSLMFASSKFDAADLLKVLKPEYSKDSILQHSQKKLFDNALPKLLETWQRTDRDMLRKFLSFTTGLSYLPFVPDFCITIKFETKSVPGNSSSETRLPESHTCVRTLSIPRTAYNGDYEVFQEKLGFVVESDYKTFTQN